MRDLKQRLFDLLRSGGISVGDNTSSNNSNTNNDASKHSTPNQQMQQQLYSSRRPMQKPKKLHEYTAADCNAAFLRKYHDLSISKARERQMELDVEIDGAANVIYFNENLSMTSKYNVRQFPLTRYPSCPLSSFGLSQRADDSPDGSLAGDTESDRYNFCLDEDHSSNARTLKLRHQLHMEMDADVAPDRDADAEANADVDIDVDIDDDHAESHLDSFCTLCTSTFSYNKCCRYCDNSLCGSKCNSERSSHASHRSCNRSSNYDNGLDFSAQFIHQRPPHHKQRFGATSRILSQQPIVTAISIAS